MERDPGAAGIRMKNRVPTPR
ncbi:MAG: hypothetical protein H6Q84_3250, partial [Deltaproteobacteria bacterium]|nr:hypothetical protein [Deltaproteobacteria bacterium]